MKHIRRLLAVVLTLNAALCLVLLLNFTAPNPTGRRYASQMPITTGRGTAAEIGRSAELILAQDLRLPRNDQADQRKCLCNSYQASLTPPSECSVCVASVAMSAPFRRPDFFGSHFIAEAKNTQGLSYEGRELDQITDYAQAARQMRIPLYVYTRVNAQVDAIFDHIVAETGGAVVRYFPVPGWSDPVDVFARSGLLVSLFGWALLWLSAPRPRASAPRIPVTVRPHSALRKALDDVDKAQEIVRRTSDRLREELD